MPNSVDKKEHKPDVKLHVWLEENSGVYFGQGRYELLHLIDELGSLKLAAEKMGISYRGAWGKIKKTEEILGRELIYKDNNNKEGYKLTEFGKEFMKEFKKFHDEILKFASKNASEMLDRLKKFHEVKIISADFPAFMFIIEFFLFKISESGSFIFRLQLKKKKITNPNINHLLFPIID